MIAEISSLNLRNDYLEDVKCALLLLKVFNIEGGHSDQVINEVLLKAEDSLNKHLETANRR